MSGSKHFDKIAWSVTALMLVITVLFMNGASLGIEIAARTMGYENRLFDNTRVHTIDIVMNDWDKFIANATSEEYYAAHVIIDGEAYKNVGIRGKGNTSLSTVSSLGSQRYSFKIEFDQYDGSMTYHGLDKLSLNNLIQDLTMMKDYLTYTMMNEFGAAAPLCSFVYITVNGEDWGLYLAVEGVEDSFLQRNYGTNYGELYKPDSLSFGGGRGNGKDFDMGNFDFSGGSESSANGSTFGSFDPSSMFGGMMGGQMPDMSGMFGGQMPDMSDMFGGESGFDMGGMGGFGMGSSDVKLQYVDDNLDSYSNIWNNAKTDITQNDQYRLIESIRKLTNGEEIESVVDIEQVIRYFVVHNYVCNGDSYTGSMIHNYYLYEENGQLSMLPWDYNLAYGTFQGGNGQSTVNTPIDAPVSGGEGSDRPMWYWILSDETYTALYHQYFAEFLSTVDIAGIIDNAYNLIKSYVAKDPTAFFTYEEFELGVETMRRFCELRSESISMQLANNQTTTNMNYADASDLTLSDMGSMGGMGGGMPDMGGNWSDFGGWNMSGRQSSGSANGTGGKLTSAVTENIASGTVQNLSSMFPGGMGGFSGGFDPSQIPNMGNLPEGFDPSQMPSMGGMFPGGSSWGSSTTPSDGSAGTGNSDSTIRPSSGSTQMPDFNMSGASGTVPSTAGWMWIFVSFLFLSVGLIVAKLYRY